MTISAPERRCDTALVRHDLLWRGPGGGASDRRGVSFPMRTEGCDTSTGCFEVRVEDVRFPGRYVDEAWGCLRAVRRSDASERTLFCLIPWIR